MNTERTTPPTPKPDAEQAAEAEPQHDAEAIKLPVEQGDGNAQPI